MPEHVSLFIQRLFAELTEQALIYEKEFNASGMLSAVWEPCADYLINVRVFNGPIIFFHGFDQFYQAGPDCLNVMSREIDRQVGAVILAVLQFRAPVGHVYKTANLLLEFLFQLRYGLAVPGHGLFPFV
jgi:hypothetical protein